MIKSIVAGLWVFAVTTGSIYLGSTWNAPSKEGAEAGPPLELVELKPITVPVVNEAGLEGYLLAVLNYNIDRTKLANPKALVDPILQDESFRSLYGVDSVKYKKPRKSDLTEISKSLVASMNARLGAEAVKDVLIVELSYIPKEKARAGRGG